MPITVPITGTPIASAWGKSVADAINNAVPLAASHSAPLETTTTDQLVPGCTLSVTTTVPETWLIVAAADIGVPTLGASNVRVSAYLDGSALPMQLVMGFVTAGLRATGSCVWVATPNAGAHTLELRAKKDAAGGSGQVNAARVSVIRIPR